jgi:hypothetical protein
VCLVGGGIAPLWSAGICRFISRIAVKDVFPHEPLPAVTQMWVAGVANGTFPVLLIALLISALVFVSGFYFLLSRRPSPEARTSGLVAVCSVGYTIAAVGLASTMMGLVIPFIKQATEG